MIDRLDGFYSKSTFRTPSLEIDTSLAGRAHHFRFEGADIQVHLPHHEEASEVHEDGRMWTIGWRLPNHEPTEYLVHDVSVYVFVSDPTRVREQVEEARGPSGMLTAGSIASNDTLADLLRRLGDRALRAATHWTRIVQWRTDRWYIGRPRHQSHLSPGTWLLDARTDERIVNGPIRLTGSTSSPLVESDWENIQSALTADRECPLFYSLLFDGQEHLSQGDYRRAIVDFAVACEVLLRFLLDRDTPDGMAPPLRAYVLRAQARTLLDRFLPVLLAPSWLTASRAQVATLRQLLERRNALMHHHEPPQITHQECYSFFKATASLVEEGARILGQLPNS